MLKEPYGIAKVALFNVRLMRDLQHSEAPVVKEIIEGRWKKDKMTGNTPILINQTTFLQFAYICLVWLWESARKAKKQEEIAQRLDSGEWVPFPSPEAFSNPGKINDFSTLLSFLRDAISHGSVGVTDQTFIFSGKPRRRGQESHNSSVTLRWEYVAQLSEGVLYTLTEVVWPEAGGVARGDDNHEGFWA